MNIQFKFPPTQVDSVRLNKLKTILTDWMVLVVKTAKSRQIHVLEAVHSFFDINHFYSYYSIIFPKRQFCVDPAVLSRLFKIPQEEGSGLARVVTNIIYEILYRIKSEPVVILGDKQVRHELTIEEALKEQPDLLLGLWIPLFGNEGIYYPLKNEGRLTRDEKLFLCHQYLNFLEDDVEFIDSEISSLKSYYEDYYEDEAIPTHVQREMDDLIEHSKALCKQIEFVKKDIGVQ
jgi:hypothetical protein